MQLIPTITAALTVIIPATVSAHAAITGIKGLNGIEGRGLGVDPLTPRNGGRANPFQRDSSIIRDGAIRSGVSGPCGWTKQSGMIDIDRDVEALIKTLPQNQLPTIAPATPITMTFHQVNQDGAGPVSCELSSSTKGDVWVPLTITQDVPGIMGFSAARARDFPLTVEIPKDATPCAASRNGNVCLIRCRTARSIAGPFGSCVPVAMESGVGARVKGREPRRDSAGKVLGRADRAFFSKRSMLSRKSNEFADDQPDSPADD
ncbi:hypothetical protein PYCC9005_002551 [Savitreella phatthalungensis]